MKLAVLSYDHPSDHSHNYGDEVQSIAAARLLPHVDLKIPRTQLRSFPLSEPCLLIMNGYFRAMPGEFPPSDNITPLYISFYMEKEAESFYTSKECVDHFKRHEPIGCRSRRTMQVLREAGVDAYYSKCLSMTLPRRGNVQGANSVVTLDVPVYWIRENNIAGHFIRHLLSLVKREDAGRSINLYQGHNSDHLGDQVRTEVAHSLLQRYKREARIILTSRLHCALPCIAMGIPVMYFTGGLNHRTEILQELGVVTRPKISYSKNRYIKKIQELWGCRLPSELPVIDIAEDKKTLIEDFRNRLKALIPGIQMRDTAELMRDEDW